MIPDACTNMLYNAADTVRLRTALELREFQPTWIGCAITFELNSECGY
jgi:hypothetical protein